MALAPVQLPPVPPTPEVVPQHWLHMPHHWPEQVDLLDWAQHMSPGAAAILVIGGIVYLGFGWYLFKALVTLNAALVGMYFGALLGQKGDSVIAGGILGLIYKYQGLSQQVTDKMLKQPFILPAAIFIPAVVGLIYQQTAYPPGDPAGKKK